MRRINLPLLLLLLGLLAAGGVGVFFVHRHQVRRNAATMATLADERLEEGKEDEAIEILSRYVVLRPEDQKRQRQYAELLLDRVEAGRADARGLATAKWAMEKAVRTAPDDDRLRGRFAEFLFRSGELSMAHDHYTMLLGRLDAAPAAPAAADTAEEGGEDAPDRDRIALLCAAVAGELGRFDEAEDLLSRLVGFDAKTKEFTGAAPTDARIVAAYPALAQIEERHRRDPKTAARIIDRLATAHPEDTTGVKLLAAWHIDHGDLDAADEAIARATALDPDDDDIAFLDLQAALARKDDDRAQAILEGPLADAPATPPIVVARAALLQRRGDSEGRLRVLREALADKPTNGAYRAELLLALVEARKIEELQALLEESRPLLARDAPAVMYADAAIAMNEQRWIPAQRILEQLRPLVATNDAFTRRVDLALSTCHGALGQIDQATDARNRALQTIPGSRVARFAELQTLEQTGRSAEALAIAEELAAEVGAEKLTGTRELWLPLFRLRLLEQLRKPEGNRDWTAIDALLAAVAADGADPVLLARLSVDLVAARDTMEAAIEASDRAMRDHPDAASLVAQRVMLLAGTGRIDESRALLEGMSEEVRDSPDIIEAEVRLAAVTPRDESAKWIADVEGRIDGLPDTEADRVAKQLIAIHVGRGAMEEAEGVARRSIARSPDNLPVHLVLLDLVAARQDAEAVGEQVAAITRIAGRESATGRLAEAVQRIVGVSLARKGSAGQALRPEEITSLDLARGLLAEAARDRPRWSDIPRAQATIAELQGDNGAAIGFLRQAAELGEMLPFARRRLVLLLAGAGRLEEAIPVIRSLGDAGGPAVERLRAEALAAAGRQDDALAIAAKLTPDDCRDTDQLLWYVSVLSRCQRTEEAEAACRRAIESAPANPRAWATLFGVQMAASAPDRARRTADEAIAALDGEDRARFERLVDETMGDPDATEARCRAAAEADPRDMDAARRLVEVLLRRRKDPEAREELRRMISVGAADRSATVAWARRALAAQLASAGPYRDFLEAVTLLEANVDGEGKQLPEDLTSSILLLMGREEPSSWRRAVTLFDELAKRRPLTVDERVGLARLQARLGARSRARDELAAIASSPNSSVGVVNSLVEILLDDGDTRGAAKWIERLRATIPDSPSTVRLETKLAVAEGDLARAATMASSLVPEEPLTAENANRLLQCASLAEQLGFPEAGDRVLREFAAVSPGGRLLHGTSLGRRHLTDEALEELAAVHGQVSPMAFLDAVTTVVRHASNEITPDRMATIDEWIARARRENPGSPEVEIQAAILEDALGKSEAAERSYRALIADESLSPVQQGIAAANLAWILARPDSAEEASTLVDRAVQTLGPLPDVLDTRALVRLAKGQKTLALEDMREAVLVPTALKYLHLASIHVAASDLESARTAFERAKKLGLGKERLDERDRQRLEALEAALGPGGQS